jgi:hypothetical protein
MKWPIKNLLPKGQTRMPGVGKNKKVKSEVKANTNTESDDIESDYKIEFDKLPQADKDYFLNQPFFQPSKYYGLFGNEAGQTLPSNPGPNYKMIPYAKSPQSWNEAYQNIAVDPYNAFSYKEDESTRQRIVDPLTTKTLEYKNSDIYKERIAAAKYYDEVDLNKWMQDPSYRESFVRRYAKEDPETFRELSIFKMNDFVDKVVPFMNDASVPTEGRIGFNPSLHERDFKTKEEQENSNLDTFNKFNEALIKQKMDPINMRTWNLVTSDTFPDTSPRVMSHEVYHHLFDKSKLVGRRHTPSDIYPENKILFSLNNFTQDSPIEPLMKTKGYEGETVDNMKIYPIPSIPTREEKQPGYRGELTPTHMPLNLSYELDHDTSPEETKADIFSLRDHLRSKHGFEHINQMFDENMYNKLMQDEEWKSSLMGKRMLDRFGTDKNKWLTIMNLVADNTDKNQYQDVAKNGKKINKMDKSKKKGKYPMASDAYAYEYNKAINDKRERMAQLFFSLPPDQQAEFGDFEGFVNSMTAHLDRPVQITNSERGPYFRQSSGIGNFLSGAGLALAGYAGAGQIPYVNQMVTGDPTVYDAGTYAGMLGQMFLPGAIGIGTAIKRSKDNPRRYITDSRDTLMEGLQNKIDARLDDYDGLLKVDMSEYQYMPNAQEGAYVSGDMMMDQNQSVEDLFKNQMMDDIEKNYSSKNQIIKPFEQEMQTGGMANQMPDDVASARFKAAGKDKGLKGAELNVYVEKMKTKYGYQKGGSVYSSDVEDYYMPRFEEGGRIQYKGQNFPGYNKSINTPSGDKYKKMAMIKKGDKVKLVKYGLRKK